MARPYLLPQAVDDVERIQRYIAKDDARAAKRVVMRVKQIIMMLSHQPLLGERRDHLRPRLQSYSSGNYVIYDEPSQPRISILRVLHGGARP